MTNREAIQNLKDFEVPRLGKDGLPNDNLKEALRMAIAALEAKEPKRPYLKQVIRTMGETVHLLGCPVCNQTVYSDERACQNCGQKLSERE